MKAKEKAIVVKQRLDKLFPDSACELNFTNTFELLISVILSARCTDKRVNQITPNLFKIYPLPKDLAKANPEDVEKLIYTCGFYKNKAKSIINASKDLVIKFNSVVPENYEDLISLAGVGRKTANVVMSVGFKKDAIAVDTHVFRVSNRLGLVKAKTPLECELALQKVVDKKDWSAFHHLLVLFGRYNCKAISPQCKTCPLADVCDAIKRS